jgi:hypothetical protein
VSGAGGFEWRTEDMHRLVKSSIVAFALALGIAQANTVYTSDPNLSDFTSGVTYGTFIAAPFGDGGTTPPYTPTTADVAAGLRVFGDDSSLPLVVEFASAVSDIRVFPNIDHFGFVYDGFQYTILGSNDGVIFTPLFDALTVAGAGEPFTLDTFRERHP